MSVHVISVNSNLSNNCQNIMLCSVVAIFKNVLKSSSTNKNMDSKLKHVSCLNIKFCCLFEMLTPKNMNEMYYI